MILKLILDGGEEMGNFDYISSHSFTLVECRNLMCVTNEDQNAFVG